MTNEEFAVLMAARIAAAKLFTQQCYQRCQNAVAIVKARVANRQDLATPWENEFVLRQDRAAQVSGSTDQGAEIGSLPIAPLYPTGPVPGNSKGNYPNPTETV